MRTEATAGAVLSRCPLFSGFSPDEMEKMISWLPYEIEVFAAGGLIQEYGAPARLGIVMDGIVQSGRPAEDQSEQIIEVLEADELFGLDALFSGGRASPTVLTALTESTILFFAIAPLRGRGDDAMLARLMESAARLLADRCIRLLYKTEVLSAKLLRDQIMTFFRIMQRKQRSDTIQMKMNRQQFAQYLCVNRSALSRELGRMQRAGLLTIGKNGRFTIMHNDRGRSCRQPTPRKQTEDRAGKSAAE